MSYYEIYRATVVQNPSITDPRTTVRILTLMDGITDAKVLPKYPSFFANKLFNFQTGSTVWCLCNDTFDIGYVIGPSNVFSDAIDSYVNYSNVKDSFTKILQNTLSGIEVGLPNFSDLHFTYVDNNIMEAVSTKTGIKITYHSNGAMFVVGPVGIIMSYSDGLISLGKNTSSGSSEINITAKDIRLNGNVSLGTGTKKMYVLASKSKDAFISLSDGSIAKSSDSVVI
jgi:hypothetical protein